ncbi:MAG: cytochrome P450 [Candidatus Binatia bacterium]
MVYDPYDARTVADPFGAYRRLRDEFPVYHNEHRGFWALSRFRDVVDALRDHVSYSNREGITLDRRMQPSQPMLTNLDPPRHVKLRSLVSRAFTAQRIAAVEGSLRALAKELLAEARERGGTIDFMSLFASPLPTVIIAEMLGVPSEDREKFREWSDASNSWNPDDPEAENRVMAAIFSLVQYIAEVLQERRKSPRDDLVSKLAAAEVEGDRLADEDIVGFCFLLLVAGNETTAGLIGNTALNLHQFPDQRRLLTREPLRIAKAVEEFVRFGGSVQGLTRTTTCDVTIHGQVIPEGAIVMMLYAAANRDEREFAEPDRFDVTRQMKQHVGFGHGIHYCLGSALASLETRVAFEELLALSPEYEVDLDSVTWAKSALTRSPSSLRVRL